MNGNAWKAFGTVLVVLMVAMFIWDSRQEAGREQQAEGIERARILAEIGICERVKADRIDTARALTAEAKLLEEQLVVDGMPPKIRRRAAHAFKQTHESANQMRLRLYECEPLIREGKRVRDRDALSEAQGTL